MSIPDPKLGSVIRYDYLWSDEHDRGLQFGDKENRPCVILIARQTPKGYRVAVAPLTHSEPADMNTAVRLPPDTKIRLGLTDPRDCWIICTELNFFYWPSPELREIGAGIYEHGLLPSALRKKIISTFKNQGANYRRIDRNQ